MIVAERGNVIGRRWSEELRQIIREASDDLGIEWRPGAEVTEVNEQGITPADGEQIPSSTVIWTVGVEASQLTAQIQAQRDSQGRLLGNEFLQVPGFDDIFATDDIARAATDDKGNVALMTCQHAIMLGRFCGKPAGCGQVKYVTCLDLGGWGAVYTEVWEQEVKMTREEAKKLKLTITSELIYPPKADRKIAFETADPLAAFV